MKIGGEDPLIHRGDSRFSSKRKFINNREILYQQASQTSSKTLYVSLRNSFISLILVILISLLPKFNIGTMEDFQLMNIILLVGVYYTIKVVLIFLEILKLDIELPDED